MVLYQNRPHTEVSKGKGKASSDLGWLNKSNPEISLVTFNFAKHSFSFGFTEKEKTNMRLICQVCEHGSTVLLLLYQQISIWSQNSNGVHLNFGTKFARIYNFGSRSWIPNTVLLISMFDLF